MGWDAFNKQMSGETTTAQTGMGWDAFNTQMEEQSFRAEANAQNRIDPALYIQLKKREKEQGEKDVLQEMIETGQATTEPIGSIPPREKPTVGGVVKDFFGQMIRNIRGVSQVAATPLAGAMGIVPGGATPKEAMTESLNMAWDVMSNKNVSIDDGMEQAAKQYLEATSEKDELGNYKPTVTNMAALIALGIFNIFGDPAFELGLGLKGAKVIKEFAQFKKVGKIKKPARGKFVGATREIEMPITEDLKIKVKPKNKEVVIEGYQKRFPSQKALPEGQLSNETAELVLGTKEATGKDVIAKLDGDDLIIRPKGVEPVVEPSGITADIAKAKASGKSFEEWSKNTKRGLFDKDKIQTNFNQKDVKFGDLFSEITPRAYQPLKDIPVKFENIEKGVMSPLARVGFTPDGKEIELIINTKWGLKNDVPWLLNKILAEEAEHMLTIKGNVDFMKKGGLSSKNLQSYLKDKREIAGKINAEKRTKSQLKQLWEQEVSKQTIPSKVAKSIESKTIEEGLTKGFENMAGYEKITIKDQARRASDVMKDITKATDMVEGKIPMANGLRPEMLIKAMEDYALRTGNADLALKIAKSPLVSETSAHAQALRILAERNPDSATEAIRKVAKAKRKKAGKKKGKVAKEIKKNIKKPTRGDWEAFIKEIQC